MFYTYIIHDDSLACWGSIVVWINIFKLAFDSGLYSRFLDKPNEFGIIDLCISPYIL